MENENNNAETSVIEETIKIKDSDKRSGRYKRVLLSGVGIAAVALVGCLNIGCAELFKKFGGPSTEEKPPADVVIEKPFHFNYIVIHWNSKADKHSSTNNSRYLLPKEKDDEIVVEKLNQIFSPYNEASGRKEKFEAYLNDIIKDTPAGAPLEKYLAFLTKSTPAETVRFNAKMSQDEILNQMQALSHEEGITHNMVRKALWLTDFKAFYEDHKKEFQAMDYWVEYEEYVEARKIEEQTDI